MPTVACTQPVKVQAPATRRSRVSKTLLAAALPVWLALVPVSAMAVNAAGGSDTTVDQVVNTVGPGAWVTLRSQQINATSGPRYCIATGSSDAVNPGTLLAEQYRFTLSLAAGADPINSGRERTLEFLNTATTADNRMKEITSTWFFTLPPQTTAAYFLRWRATKLAAATANLTVADSSLSVVCTDNALPN